MQMLNGRQRVAAASLFKRRPVLLPESGAIVEDALYNFWVDLVCSEMRRLGVVDPEQVKEFCDRAGVPAEGAAASLYRSQALAW